MIAQHFPVLPIVLPLIAAPLCMLLSRSTLVWLFATLISGLSFIVSLSLLLTTLDQGVISYAVGGWPPPWGIEMRIDVANVIRAEPRLFNRVGD